MGVLSWVGEVVGGNWILTFLLAFIVFTLLVSPGGRPKNFPPGLPMLPWIGSLCIIPFGPTRNFLQGLKNKYGDMASFSMFGTRVVLVSGVSNIKTIFSQKTTAGRPEIMPFSGRNYVINNGRTGNLGIIGSEGALWQEQRRFILHHLRDLGFGKTSYEPMMLQEITELLDYVANQKGQPIPMKKLFNRSVVNVVWGMVMGKRYSYDHAKLQELLKKFIQPADFNLLGPIWVLPNICRYLPHIPILKNELIILKKINDFIEEEIQEMIASPNQDSNFSLVSVYLQEIKKRENTLSDFNMEQLVSLVWDIFVAGMETTASTLTMGMKLLTENPGVMQKVQEELDDVVGKERKPSFSDMERLPYTQATIHEIQRVFNLFRYALPHKAEEDCTLQGYSIPKGTVLLANIDHLMTDPKIWKYPKVFDPRNFLNKDGQYQRVEGFSPFGIGKRACPGESLARLEIFLFFSCLVQRFTFTMEDDTTVPINNPLFALAPEFTTRATERV